MSSSAYGVGVAATVNPLLLPPNSVGLGPLPTVSGASPVPNGIPYNFSQSVLSAALASAIAGVNVSTGVINVNASGDLASAAAPASASSTVNNLAVGLDPLNLINLLSLTATTVRSTANASCALGVPVLSGTTSIVGAAIGGLVGVGVTVLPNPPPNFTLLNLLGVSIVLNEQIVSGNSITVNAIHIRVVPLGLSVLTADIVVAQSVAQANCGSANISVVKTASPSPVVVGQALTYTLAVQNGGPDTATNVQVTDTLPSGVTLVSATPSQGSCTQAAGVITCNLGALANLDNATVSIIVTPTVAGTVINSATVASDAADPDPSNNTSTVSTVVSLAASSNLVVNKTGPASIAVGVPYNYVTTLANTGASVATQPITLSDTVAAGLTINSAIGSNGFTCAVSGQTVTCTSTTDLPASTAAFTAFTLNVTAGAALAGTSVTNTVTATGAGCPAVGTCISTTPPVTVTPSAASNLVVNKAGPTSLTVGVPFNYVTTLANTGASVATQPITLSDTVATGLTINSAIGSNGFTCAVTGQTVTCTRTTDIPANTTAFTAFTLNVTATAALAGTSVSNTATATGGGCPAVGTCTSTTPPTPVTPVAPNLVVNKTGPASIAVGVPFNYVTTLANIGASVATQPIMLSDTVATGLTINSATGSNGFTCTVAGQTVSCTRITDVPANTAAFTAFTLNVTATAALADSTVSNTATATGGGCPAVGTCTSTTRPVTVSTTVAGNLVVSKTGPASITVGVPFNYVTTLANTGAAVATQPITISDTVATGLTINTATGGNGFVCTVTGQTVNCTRTTDVAANTAAFTAFTLNVTATAALAGTSVSNTATVTGGGCLAVGTCTSTTPLITVTPTAASNLVVDKTGPASITVGVPFTYVTTLANTGASVATQPITLSDTVATGLTINSATGSNGFTCTVTGQTVSCTRTTDIPANNAAFTAFTLNVTAAAALAGTSVSNTAIVTGGGCPAVGTCTSTTPLITVTPTAASNLVVNKTGPASITVGVPFTYVTTLANTGASVATQPITLSDTVATGLTINSATGSNGFACAVSGQTVTCTRTTDIPATRVAFSAFTLNVNATAALTGTSVSNTATASGGGCPAFGTCTSTTPPTPVTPAANNLVLNKTGPTSITVGVPFNYVTTIANTGASVAAQPITLSDTVATGLTINSATGSNGFTCTISGRIVTCTRTTDMLASTAAITVFTLNVTAGAALAGTSVSNTATATGAGCPAVGTCTSTTPPTPVTPAASHLVVSKTGPSSITVGVPFNFTMTLANSGAVAAAQPMTLTDTVATGLTINSVTASNGFVCTVTGQSVSCMRSTDIPANTAAFTAFVLNVTAAPSLAGTSVSNTINVAGSGCPAVGTCASASFPVIALLGGQDPTKVPTLSEFALYFLAMLVAMLGFGLQQRTVGREKR